MALLQIILFPLCVVAKLILYVVGFRGAGVARQTLAAFIHAMIGNVTAGGVFAFCQRIGAVILPFL